MTATLPDFVIAAFVTFCRVGGCFMVMPGLSSARVPLQIRLFVAVAATFALLINMSDEVIPHTRQKPAGLVLLVISETLIGGLIGLMARFYVLALQFTASSISMMIGFNGGMGHAIEESEPQATLASLISFSALLVLFVLNFHHEIIKAIVLSYRLAPLDAFYNPQSGLVDLTDTLSEAFMVMLRLGSPFLAYSLLVNLAIGFINKLTPQIPVYFISLPFVIAGGMILLYLGAPVLLSLFADGFVSVTVGR
ncbi:MAG: flagellar type III secretion system protein FliR [Mesorhizobium sp.]|nr:flagellar type III secretion system protein FliR [Mesorhizobium sp.]